MTFAEFQELVKSVAAVLGVFGAGLGIAKYLSEKREKEVREWQKVVLYKILQQSEQPTMTFASLLEKYRLEAQAFADANLKKGEISEDALRRVLLELVSANIAQLEPSGSFRLKIVQAKVDQQELQHRLNVELARVVGPNPHTYTIDEVAKEIAPKLGLDIPIVRNTIRIAVEIGALEVDDAGRLAFPR
jgi:hypothetical protein